MCVLLELFVHVNRTCTKRCLSVIRLIGLHTVRHVLQVMEFTVGAPTSSIGIYCFR